MTYTTADIIKYRLSRAQETLEEAKIMLENSHYFAATNRCYYAAFYAVSALLLTKELRSSKHSGIMSLFQVNFIQPGIVSEDWGIFYKTIYRYRQKADYEDYPELDNSYVSDWLIKVQGFIEVLTAIINV